MLEDLGTLIPVQLRRKLSARGSLTQTGAAFVGDLPVWEDGHIHHSGALSQSEPGLFFAVAFLGLVRR